MSEVVPRELVFKSHPHHSSINNESGYLAIMSIFEQFKKRNRKIFEDMGVDSKDITFRRVSPSNFKTAGLNEAMERLLEKKSSFTSNIDMGSDEGAAVSNKLEENKLTTDSLAKRLQFNRMAPILIIATLYLIFFFLP
ncbi:MAG: hypothetical protein ACTSUE_12000 [Promethearchaeota archaeon]